MGHGSSICWTEGSCLDTPLSNGYVCTVWFEVKNMLRRFFLVIIPFLMFFGIPACTESVVTPETNATIAVHVAYGDTAVPGKSVELLETHEMKTTGADGFARFQVPPGKYTVRVHNVNGPGPALQVVDIPVEVTGTDVQTVEVYDCLPCV